MNFYVNSAANVASLFIALGSRLAVISLLTATLGLTAYGEYASLLSFCYILVTLSDLGLTLFLSKEVSQNRENIRKISELLSIFVFCKLIFSVILSSLLLVAIDQPFIIITMMIVFSVLKAADFTIFLSGLEKYTVQTNINALSALLFLSLIYLFKDEAEVLESLFLAHIAVIVFSQLAIVFYLRNRLEISFSRINFQLLREIVRKSVPFYFSRIFLNLYSYGSTYLTSLVLSLEKVAIYSIIIDLYKFGAALIGRIGGVLFTHLNFKKDFHLLKKITVASLAIHLAFLPVVYFGGEPILAFIFDFEVAEVHERSILLYCSLFMVIVCAYWNYPALTAAGLAHYSNLSVFIASVVYFVAFASFFFSSTISLYTAVLCILVFDATLLICISIVIGLFRDRFFENLNE